MCIRDRPIAGAYVTGGIYGGELSYVDDSTFNVQSVSCMSDDLTMPLALVGPTLVDLGTPVLNTVYNVFIVRTDGATYEIRTDTDVDGVNLTGITHKRWLGYVLSDASGNIIRFQMSGDMIVWNDDSVNVGTSGANDKQYDLSPWVPAGRYESVQIYSYVSSEARTMTLANDDGTDVRGSSMDGVTGVTSGTNSVSAWLIGPKFWTRVASGTGGDPVQMTAIRLKR